MKKHLSTVFLVLVFLTGCGLFLYPSVSDFWNSRRQSQVIAAYETGMGRIGQEDGAALLEAARAYNASLLTNESRFYPTEEETAYYNSLLQTGTTDMMASIQIPSIQVSLPVYHGTGEEVLQAGIGHVEGTSLPVGGASTHCVLSGHRGLPSAKLFSELDQVKEGDFFYIHVLGEQLAYQVDQIQVVEPQQMETLDIVSGKDYCTLVTCTPYGVNSHRLLVRGVRTEPEKTGEEPEKS